MAGFGAIIVADLLGYVALANYLSVAILTSAYFAVALYAAARTSKGSFSLACKFGRSPRSPSCNGNGHCCAGASHA